MQIKTGVILAGGNSSRMKFDKQKIRTGDDYLVYANIRKLKKVFENLYVVTKTPEFYSGLDVITIGDIYPGHGPISGIHAALVYGGEPIYLVAVDMPNLSEAYIALVDRLYNPSYDGLVYESHGFIEPMHAIYHPRLVPRLEENIKKSKYRISTLVDESNFKIIGADDINGLVRPEDLFENLNTQDDLNNYRSR